MVQEYLFVSDEYRDEIQVLDKPDKVEIIIEDIENNKCWIAKISMPGENEKAAIALSKMDTEIVEKYKPAVLTNGSSAYFNKTLFPLINEFERKLRKLLYLASALQIDGASGDNIQNLEIQDLGTILRCCLRIHNLLKMG